MSGDSAMFSDDERPLAPKPTANGSGLKNGNGNATGQQSDVSMSDADDDVPLVRGCLLDSIRSFY
jgi:hypothetical protein